MGKKKDARKAAEAARERHSLVGDVQKTVDALVGEVSSLKARMQAAEERVAAVAHPNDRRQHAGVGPAEG